MGKAARAARKAKDADVRTTHDATRAADGPLLRLAEKATDLADQPPLIALSVATILGGAVARRPVVWRSGARMLASHLVATGIKTVLKGAIDRTRPRRALKEGHHIGKGNGDDDSSLNSFPSGHTAGAVAIARAIAGESPRASIPAWLAAGGVAALQPRRGTHYVSDVIAGAMIGLVAGAIVDAGIRRAERAIWPVFRS